MQALPYKIATLLYCFNGRGEVLLMRRAQEPNLGLWSPPGGKLHMDIGESPFACAIREAEEEMGWKLQPQNLHLTGLVSEENFAGKAHWLMFLFEVTILIDKLPPPHREGIFSFFNREALAAQDIPQTDRETIWPLFWAHRGGFFSAHCQCRAEGSNIWTIEQA